MNTITVQLGTRSYDILVGAGILQHAASFIEQKLAPTSICVVQDQLIASTHGQTLFDAMQATTCVSIEAIEKTKTMQAVESIWDAMLASHCDRQSIVLAIGGGITGDVAGFAAASFMRGVPIVQFPTSLLAMVDASIGGKTGVNRPSSHADSLVKNMIGAFWQPSLVVADVLTLETLDDRQFNCGIAECIKHALLGNASLSSFLIDQQASICERDTTTLVDLVTMSATIKAEVVALDEHEKGSRALLNLGHTFAHAIEPIDTLQLFHGEAVAIGLCAAAACSEALGLIDSSRVDALRSMLHSFALPTAIPLPIPVDVLLGTMLHDKKTVDSNIRLVLPTNDGAVVMEDIDVNMIRLAWSAVGAQI